MAVYKHDHTHLTSTDPEKAAEFYIKVIGAKLVKKQEIVGRKMIDIDLGGVLTRISASTGADNSWKGLKIGLHHLGLIVDDLDKAVAKMKSQGVEFVVNPNQPKPGLKAMFIKGPDDILIEVLEIKET